MLRMYTCALRVLLSSNKSVTSQYKCVYLQKTGFIGVWGKQTILNGVERGVWEVRVGVTELGI